MNSLKLSKQSIFFATVFIICIIYAAFFKKDYRLKLKEGKTQVTIGQVTREYLPVRSGGHYIDYSYQYKGNKRRDSREISDVLHSPQRFVNKFFPVIVSDEDDESEILITPEDFAFFKNEFPDSLVWVVQWVKKK